jgi:hypothetical protein
MALSWEEITERALAALSNEERRSGAVYLDQKDVTGGSVLKIDNKEVRVPWSAAVVFVDRKPEANWSHSCRYLLVNRSSGEIESIEANFPPFLRGVPETLRLIWKGRTVPEWALAVR